MSGRVGDKERSKQTIWDYLVRQDEAQTAYQIAHGCGMSHTYVRNLIHEMYSLGCIHVEVVNTGNLGKRLYRAMLPAA